MAHVRRRAVGMIAVASAILLMTLLTVPSLVTAWRAYSAIEAIPVSTDVWSDLVADAPATGSAQAPMTIVVFGDYQCPACAAWGRYLDKFVTANQPLVRIVWRNLPLESIHRHARNAAQAAECAAQQGAFEQYHRALYQQPDKIGRVPWRSFAAGTGIDGATLEACVAAGRGDARIRGDLALAQRLQLHGTPSFVINGRLYRRMPPVAELERLAFEASFFNPEPPDTPRQPPNPGYQPGRRP